MSTSHIIEKCQANRPARGKKNALSFNSAKQYASTIKNIAKRQNCGIDDLTYEKVWNDTKDASPNDRRTRMSAVLVYNDDGNHIPFVSKLRDEIMNCKYAIDAKQFNDDGREPTEKEKENLIPYDEVMEKYHTLEKRVKPFFRPGEQIPKSLMKLIQTYVLLSCYLLIPPRRALDFTEFKLRNINENEDNYMHVNKSKAQFIFNKYKTAYKYGKQVVDIPNSLKHIIMKWKSVTPSDYLLVGSTSGKPVFQTTITNMLHNFFNKRISCNALRKIVITHKDNKGQLNTHKKMRELAKDMGHSVETQQSVDYLKNMKL